MTRGGFDGDGAENENNVHALHLSVWIDEGCVLSLSLSLFLLQR